MSENRRSSSATDSTELGKEEKEDGLLLAGPNHHPKLKEFYNPDRIISAVSCKSKVTPTTTTSNATAAITTSIIADGPTPEQEEKKRDHQLAPYCAAIIAPTITTTTTTSTTASSPPSSTTISCDTARSSAATDYSTPELENRAEQIVPNKGEVLGIIMHRAKFDMMHFTKSSDQSKYSSFNKKKMEMNMPSPFELEDAEVFGCSRFRGLPHSKIVGELEQWLADPPLCDEIPSCLVPRIAVSGKFYTTTTTTAAADVDNDEADPAANGSPRREEDDEKILYAAVRVWNRTDSILETIHVDACQRYDLHLAQKTVEIGDGLHPGGSVLFYLQFEKAGTTSSTTPDDKKSSAARKSKFDLPKSVNDPSKSVAKILFAVDCDEPWYSGHSWTKTFIFGMAFVFADARYSKLVTTT